MLFHQSVCSANHPYILLIICWQSYGSFFWLASVEVQYCIKWLVCCILMLLMYCCQAEMGGDIGDWEPDDTWPYGSVTSFNPYHCDLAALEVCLFLHFQEE